MSRTPKRVGALLLTLVMAFCMATLPTVASASTIVLPGAPTTAAVSAKVRPPAEALQRSLRTITVPYVWNMSAKSSVATLQRLGFHVVVKEKYHPKVARYRIIYTDPRYGTVLPRGATVTVWVSKGPQPTHQAHSWDSDEFSVYGGGSESQHVAWSEVHGTTTSFSQKSPYFYYFAHKTMPFGTRIHFKYNGREVIGICVDRGPYVGGRVFDLGHNIARQLGTDGVGYITWDYED